MVGLHNHSSYSLLLCFVMGSWTGVEIEVVNRMTNLTFDNSLSLARLSSLYRLNPTQLTTTIKVAGLTIRLLPPRRVGHRASFIYLKNLVLVK